LVLAWLLIIVLGAIFVIVLADWGDSSQGAIRVQGIVRRAVLGVCIATALFFVANVLFGPFIGFI
jgi:hypothetical protein